MNERINLKASESRLIKPFLTVDELFKNLKIFYSSDIGWVTDTTIYKEDEKFDKLDLSLDIKEEILTSILEGSSKDYKVSIVFKDHSAKYYTQLDSFSLNELDKNDMSYYEKVSSNFALGNFTISAILTKKSTVLDDQIKRLATKDFKFVANNRKIDFPKIWKRSEDFAAIGLPRDSLWFLRWKGADLDRPINELVELWLNEDLKTKVTQITVGRNKSVTSQISASILLDIYFPIIEKTFDNDAAQDFKSTAFQTVFKQLKGNFVEDEEELRAFFERDDFHSILGAWCNKLTLLTTSLGGVSE